MKVADSYPTILGGVSQQPPHARLPGQHTEQINLWSDPVRGLVRRHGSRFIDAIPGAATADELASCRTAHLRVGGHDLIIALPQVPCTVPCVVFDRSSNPIPRASLTPTWALVYDTFPMLLDSDYLTLPP